MVIFICAARQVHVAIQWKRTMYTVHHKSVEVGLVRVPTMARLQADHINIHKPSINNCVIIFYWLVLELTDLKLVQAIRFYHPGKEWKTRENDQPDCLQHTCNISNSNGDISQHY